MVTVIDVLPLILDNDVVVGVVFLHGWGWDIVASAPDLDLGLSVLLGCLSLVQTGQSWNSQKRHFVIIIK